MDFDTRIDGRLIRCTLTPSQTIASPVLCFSCMAPMVPEDGFARLRSVGGYTELQLPDLTKGEPLAFAISHENPDFAPSNRAWLPLGSYLRAGKQIIPLTPQHETGVAQDSIDYPDGTPPALLICPQPTDFTPQSGTLKIKGIQTDDPQLGDADRFAQRIGLGPLIQDGGVSVTTSHDASLGDESYRLTLSPAGIDIAFSTPTGAFYAGVTLATLIATHAGNLPCGTIHDSPRFEWRGQHLDCARHFYSVDTILRLLDLMALMKLNRFHWHFADDEAFRLTLDSLPELAQTQRRGENALIPGVFGGGPEASGGYSRADAERVIQHANALHIEVLPEIEVPAHALTLCKLYPDTRDPQDTGREQSVQGYYENVMNPAQPESWRILEAMVKEVAEIFPFEVLHLGGDELPEDTWQGSPAAKQLMTQEGLSSTQDLQGWTMHKLAKFTANQGKTPAGWEESTRGTPSIENDAIIFSWTGQGPGLEAARNGHKVVMMPGQHTYFDMAQSDATEDWGASWAAIIGLTDTIAWDPVPDDEPELAENIIGVEGAFWSEFTIQDQDMEPMLAPRILGLAAMCWQPKASMTEETLFGLRATYASVFEQIGWTQS
ncbi:beta-N-acetylhexosaminidase [Cognatishimia sp.]|uniref:beta-N-acetylhexosaminidase n=1 Tax=Cognatishimia sp. TaxID=2211648 RepID=UPI0035131393